MDEGGKRYRLHLQNESWWYNGQHGDYIEYTIYYIVYSKLYLKSSHKNFVLYVVMDVN